MSGSLPPESRPRRLESIDILRGVVMLLMAIDHTRDYFSNLPFEPEDLQHTWGALFLTRWITHFCAPLFFFLAGTGAYFYGLRRTGAELRRFLWTRGLWLILLEFTVVGFGWTFVAPWGFFGVIWALGASMVILALGVRLPVRWLALVSTLVVVAHDLFDAVRPAGHAGLDALWRVLHVKGGIEVLGTGVFVLFPLIPWCAVMGLGFAFGAVLQRPELRLRIGWAGLGMTLLFVLLRATNLYGNPPALPGGVTPGDWSLQPTITKSVILFLDTEKYPASLQFLLMTLGPSLILLAWLQGHSLGALGRFLAVFGRVPLFFYVLHLYLIHLLAVLAAALVGQPYDWLLHGAFWMRETPEAYGHGLPFMYAMWLLTIALLYLPCRWFARLKSRRHERWLSYL
ncbi:MAG: heparan-alpha-glucosaminide N-acetyltransferase domain-containing protein [Acidobacteriota bacterium]